jgi:hypothetical protein
MKSIFSLIALLAIWSNIHSQTIKENQVDEFTKNKVIRTSWEFISKSKIYAHVRASKINGDQTLDFRFMLPGGDHVFAIPTGDAIMFKLENDSIITLKNTEHKISCSGCGAVNIIGSQAEGVEIFSILSQADIEQLSKYKIKKIRLYTTDGYREAEIADKFQDIIKKELLIII